MSSEKKITTISMRPIICVVGARPNFMKMAPILRAFAVFKPEWPVLLVHTGQHYDAAMSDRLFKDLGLPIPDVNLEVGSGSHAVQTAEVMRRFEPILDQHTPACVVVVGDVNSTLACALVATKKGIPVAHVEAGLRSNDRSMPEEINRILTDQISTRLYTTERSAKKNLVREGIAENNIRFVGNVMIDSLKSNESLAKNFIDTVRLFNPSSVNLFSKNSIYGLVTLHRPSNVDNVQTLTILLKALSDISVRLPLIFALHPRTKSNIEKYKLSHLVNPLRTILLPPQGYLEMLGLMKDASVVLTDSGGIQEETTALGVPCLTLRENTERPITVEQGTNTLVGRDPVRITGELDLILQGKGKRGLVPELWDGQAAKRIASDIHSWILENSTESI